jgi:hypothetical protein
MSSSSCNKKGNEYADELGVLYRMTPKAVFAALAVSALTVGGEYLGEATPRLLREWWVLYNTGVVPQKPPLPCPWRLDDGLDGKAEADERDAKGELS